jgi:thioester reductase-like protein
MNPTPFTRSPGRAGPTYATLADCLTQRAAEQPDKTLFSFLDVDGKERDTYTYLAFQERTRHLAEHLAAREGLKRGDRVMLVYPPGLEVIVAFFACARIGVIPVPVYPPTPMNFESGLAKLAFVASDCGARAALTTRGFYRSYRLLLAKRKLSSPWRAAPGLPKLDWVTTDDVRGVASDSFADDPGEVLFLQYTSGSTSDPKGVVVSHRNVIVNGFATVDHAMVGVSWLPQYHDMGLIGYYLFPVVVGGQTFGFSPLDFLKRPALWLETISRVRSTYASSPNFGYEYCLRPDKLSDDELTGLDLSSVRVMMNAAEPVRSDTYERFFERFAPLGLRPGAHVAAFGLAENTLCVSNHGRHLVTVNKRLLQQRKLHVEPSQQRNVNQTRIVSCGAPLAGVGVRIVDPDTSIALRDEEIGEVWISGASVCAGYWNRPELTEAVFGAKVQGEPRDDNAYLRTGDLGFLHEGELYICGRIKDLIIIRGVNYYPQDIEKIVESASPRIRTGGACAFDVDDDGEALVVIIEVRTPNDLPDAREIARAIRTQYYIEPRTIAFVPPKTIAKTTSGKIARNLTRQRWLDGELAIIATHVSVADQQPAGDLSGLRERFQYIVELYNLTGHEEYTFAEIGIDSLTMVQLIEDIKGLLEEHGAGELVKHVDVKLLQRLTIAEFFALIDQFEKSSDQPVIALRYVLKKIQDEHETYERDCMRADAVLEASRIAISTADAVTNVLLTGATGFFGPFLLSSLLRRTPYTFYALTRATDPVHGLDRIRASLRRSRIWTPALDEELERRVHVVCGDVSRHNLGLKSEQWKSLTHRVQAVVHNAALVNYVMSYDALRPHNVDATRELLRFAATDVRKVFHLVSSTFIYGWTVKDVLWESDANSAMENLDFGYAQSKWVAEQLVHAAGKQGLDVRVYRPSLISASTGGVGSRDDIAVRLLAFMINHGVGVDAKNQVSFSPADIVADNIAAIVVQPGHAGRTFHATVDDYYNMQDVTRTITKNYGYSFAYYDIPRFVAEMNRRATKDDLIYPLLDFFNRSQAKLAAMQHKRYNNDGYRAARTRAVDGRPDPRLEETVTYLMDFMFREGIVRERADGGVASA